MSAPLAVQQIIWAGNELIGLPYIYGGGHASFISPGHVPLLYSAPGLLAERKGHTELAISLARMAGVSESVTVCEMLGDSGGARAPGAARRYAEDHGFEFLEGRTIVEAWRTWSSA